MDLLAFIPSLFSLILMIGVYVLVVITCIKVIMYINYKMRNQ